VSVGRVDNAYSLELSQLTHATVSPRFGKIRRVLGTAGSLVGRLARRDLRSLERVTGGRRFSATELYALLAELAPWRIEMWPSWAESRAELMQVAVDPETWRIRVPLWSKGRPTDVIVTTMRVDRPDGLHDETLESIEVISGFVPAPGAVSVKELAAQDAFTEERLEESRRWSIERSAHLRTLPAPDLPPEVDRPLRIALRALVEGDYARIATSPEGPSPERLGELLQEYGGGWVLAPQVVPPDTELYLDEPDVNHGHVECYLWNADGETDVMVYFDLSRTNLDDDFTVAVGDIRIP